MPARELSLRGSRSPAGHVLMLGALLFVGAFAYRALLLDALPLPASAGFEQWFFTPDQSSPLLPIGIAVWMLALRRPRLLALPARSAPVGAAALLAAGVGLFAWAHLAGERAFLLPSLAANLLGFAAATRGRAGCRAALLPALVLLLAFPLPAPLRDGLLWRLQLWSAHGATWLLHAAGVEVVLAGVQIHSGEYAFSVIETCSGLRGIEILGFIALAIRELFAAAGARSWSVVLIAPLLGFALNLLRIAAVVVLTASDAAEAGVAASWDHTPQGVAVLVAGTAVLYALGRWIAGSVRPEAPGDRRHADAGSASSPASARISAAGVLAVLALLAILSQGLAPLPRTPPPPDIGLPLAHAGWSGLDLPVDRVFIGQFLPGQVLHRRYQKEVRGRPPRVVDLLVGYEALENPSSRLLSPKLLAPAHDWSLVDAGSTRLWLLGLDARSAVASRGSELLLGYLWRVRDEGIWRETWRAVLALDVGPWRRERRRVVVRLTTPLANDGSWARDRAKQTLDRFIEDFRSELAGL